MSTFDEITKEKQRLGEALAREARDFLAAADDAVSSQADVRTGGPLNDAKKELAEAWLTLALVRDLPLPGPAELGIEIAPYCNGLAEAASELRRQLLEAIPSDHEEAAHGIGDLDPQHTLGHFSG